MDAIIGGIEARLDTLGFPVWVADATGADKYPYVLVVPPGGDPDRQVLLGGDRSPVSDILLVRPVGMSHGTIAEALKRTRTVLTRNGGPLTFTVPGWRVTLVREGSMPVSVDRDVTTTTQNKHPMFVTDEYTLTAVPL